LVFVFRRPSLVNVRRPFSTDDKAGEVALAS
jgi:hypothetical protein